jgi:sugar phosphate isomerase/epimerase
MIPVGLNPYGIAYCNGIAGRNTNRANPRPLTLAGYINLAGEIGCGGIEFHFEMLTSPSDSELSALRDRLAEKRWFSVVSSPLPDIDAAMAAARAVGARLCRMHLSPVLCGDRAAPECDWPATLRDVRTSLKAAATRGADQNLRLAIENHQDFTSEELLELCDLSGENVGVCFDCGNALSVGEDPVAFATAIRGRTFHIHLKDYRAQFTDEGYRLIRCPIGDGAVNFPEIFRILDGNTPPTATIECGALNARHIRLFTPQWWQHYPPKRADQLAAAIRAARVNRLPEDADWRTPWEVGASPEEIVRYEMEQLQTSVANLKRMGLM